MRNILHDVLSSVSLSMIDAGSSSKNKIMTHPTRTPASTNSFTLKGKACSHKYLLEMERRIFSNK